MAPRYRKVTPLTSPVHYNMFAVTGCAAVYYAACLPTAGCGSTEIMTSCIEELMTLDCPDMSVCGNDCTIDDGDPVRNTGRGPAGGLVVRWRLLDVDVEVVGR